VGQRAPFISKSFPFEISTAEPLNKLHGKRTIVQSCNPPQATFIMSSRPCSPLTLQWALLPPQLHGQHHKMLTIPHNASPAFRGVQSVKRQLRPWLVLCSPGCSSPTSPPLCVAGQRKMKNGQQTVTTLLLLASTSLSIFDAFRRQACEGRSRLASFAFWLCLKFFYLNQRYR
jgi:hypothetical protein